MISTIGHSTHSLADFIHILKAHRINILIDVRTIPRSRFNPHFNQNSFARALEKHDITYLHFPELGGLRRPLKNSLNLAWRNLSFRGYADYMQTSEFVHGVRHLMNVARKKRVALMCAEGNPFRCHRSLIADALTARKVRVWEISSATAKKRHTLTSFAHVEGTKVTYPLSETEG